MEEEEEEGGMKRSTAEAIWRGRGWTGDKPGWPHAAMDGAPARRGLAPPPRWHRMQPDACSHGGFACADSLFGSCYDRNCSNFDQ